MTVEERIRETRKELEALQTGEHPAHEAQRQAEYIEALKRERGFVDARRAAALVRGDKHERIPSPFRPGEYVEGELSGTEAAERCAKQLADIDHELERVHSLSSA